MATIVLSREGGFLKFVDGTLIKYYNLNDIVAMIKDGTKVTWCDGRAYDYTDILSPSFSSAEQFADQIGIWKAEAQAGSGTFAIPHVVNFSALPAPATVPNQYYFCDNSEGTKWLPGTIGGTYYNAGLYRSDGTQWLTAENPYQATLAQVNAGVNDTNFLTPFTFSNSDKIVNSFQKNVDTSDQITEGTINLFEKNFTFTQATAASAWVITHNLGKIPSITVVDTTGNIVVGCITLTSGNEENELTINFNAPFSGKASLN